MAESPPPVSPRLFDRHFRWRGTSVSRLEGFCDAVFAIVLALLFLRAAPPENFTDLHAAMKSLVPFAATFAIVGYIWTEHYLFARRYDLHDGWTTLLNLLLLFLLLFYAYPMKFLFTLMSVSMFGRIGALTQTKLLEGLQGEADAIQLFVFYGVGYGSIFAVLALLYQQAWRRRDQLSLDAVERALTRSGRTQCLLQAGIAAISIGIATTYGVAWGAPGWVYAMIGPLMAAHGFREGRKIRNLLPRR
ncbi:MAG: DUF1211 domain-containing protein [Planctomycetes bacterium]|nr:DUF1211 domain-containing protein [Planctomycetota bacterium]MCC7398612.1 DUF1211 domain-containing protein [Planctomycetota bacterium]